MSQSSRRKPSPRIEVLPPSEAADLAVPAALPVSSPAGLAALAAAQAFARKATAAATLRAYKADWTHFAAWCEAHGFLPVPAAPETIGAYLASLDDANETRDWRIYAEFAHRSIAQAAVAAAKT